MQQPQIPVQQFPLPPAPGSGKAALRYGLIFGGSIGLIDILYTFLLDRGSITWFDRLFPILYRLPTFVATALSDIIISSPIYVLLFVGFVLAGVFAARKSKRASSGALAGLLAGGAFLLLDLLIGALLLTVLVVFPQYAQIPQTSPADLASMESGALTQIMVYALVADLVLLGIGALLGWLGGAMGGGKSAPAQAQQYMFAAHPIYPPQVLIPANPNPMPMQPGQPMQRTFDPPAPEQ
jgi:hypothetical protein